MTKSLNIYRTVSTGTIAIRPFIAIFGFTYKTWQVEKIMSTKYNKLYKRMQ